MANLTGLGEQYFLTMAQGGLAAKYTTGYDRIGLYGSVGGAADSLIDTIKTITWGFSVGKTSIYIAGTDPLFTITANTVVKGIALFNSGVRNAGSVGAPDIEFSTTGNLDLTDVLARYALEIPRSFVNAGTAELSSLTYNFERIDL